jgi:glycosyltransferase involved in cell wall biosynthesis
MTISRHDIIPPEITAIIPAWDEEDTIGDIVEAFLWAKLIRPIIVAVDSKTEDDTAIIAGANIKGEHNGFVINNAGIGKGQVLMAALSEVRTPYVFFCDADIKGLTANHISLMISDAMVEEQSMTIGIPDLPDNYPKERDWAYPWVSGIRCFPTRLVRPLNLHGYLTEVQLNAAASHAEMSVRFEWLRGVKSPYVMSDRRLADIEADAAWGKEHGILP